MIRNRKRSKKRGSVLIYSLIFMSIIIIMALGISKVAIRDTDISVSTAGSSQAMQAANSGVEDILGEINSNQANKIEDVWSCSSGKVSRLIGGNSSYEVEFYDSQTGGNLLDCTDNVYDIKRIRSTGFKGDISRTFELELSS